MCNTPITIMLKNCTHIKYNLPSHFAKYENEHLPFLISLTGEGQGTIFIYSKSYIITMRNLSNITDLNVSMACHIPNVLRIRCNPCSRPNLSVIMMQYYVAFLQVVLGL